MTVSDVYGASGYIDTNFVGKTAACIDALKTHDYVYLHIEAPYECGHRFEIENKVRSLEIIDTLVLTPLVTALSAYEDYKIMILPDHATPLELKTHTSDAVPYLIYQKTLTIISGVSNFDESQASLTKQTVSFGPSLMDHFLELSLK